MGLLYLYLLPSFSEIQLPSKERNISAKFYTQPGMAEALSVKKFLLQ
jgi:hypothetical protein